jgi:hypothetical protein
MPRDCTDPPSNWFSQDVQSSSHGVSHTMTKKNKRVQPRKQKKATPFADAGAIAGQALGQMFRAPYLKGVGKWLGSGIGQIFGSGDYDLVGPAPSYNVLTSDRQIPKFSTTERTNIVCHREYLGEVTGGSAFFNRAYPLNPGFAETFPWLSNVAQSYQQYRFHGLIFEFRPLITDFVTNGSPGVCVMATNYNSDKPAFTSRIEMENSEYAVSVKPTKGMIHGVECSLAETPTRMLYVRTGEVPAGQDLRLYDLGLTQFATQGNPAQVLGELWVSYCVEFFKPILADDLGTNGLSESINRSQVSNSFPLGLVGVSASGDLPGVSVSSTQISFGRLTPPGTYQVNLMWSGDTAAAYTQPTIAITGGLAFVNQYFNGGANTFGTETGNIVRRTFLNMCVDLAASSDTVQTITLSGATLPTSNTNVNVYIVKCDSF